MTDDILQLETIADRLLTPEQKLCAAMIQQTNFDLRRASKRGGIWLDAHEWATSEYEGPLSFLWCCGMLGLTPQTVRRLLKVEED